MVLRRRTTEPETPKSKDSVRPKKPSIHPLTDDVSKAAIDLLKGHLEHPGNGTSPSDLRNALEVLKLLPKKDSECMQLLERIKDESPLANLKIHARNILKKS